MRLDFDFPLHHNTQTVTTCPSPPRDLGAKALPLASIKDSAVKQSDAPSLLPYLRKEGQCAHLNLSLFSGGSTALEEVPFPFLILSDRDPICRMLHGRFLTDSGSVLRDIMLLVQKDCYGIGKDPASPWNNPAVEDLWRNAFAFYRKEPARFFLMSFAAQTDEEGRLLPFGSLFFCKTREFFFPPPCPNCGSILGLCRTDSLLEKAGLPGFSASLNRYLFCSSCSETSSTLRFYASELGSYDPPIVKDRAFLVREWGRLLDSGRAPDGFPCRGCSEIGSCHGPEQKASWRIVPFSFYPFFLLMFESMPLEATDFLALVSGASWHELESRLREQRALGRMGHLTQYRDEAEGRSSFLFREDARFFLETLYLKLTFLAQLADEILGSGHSQRMFQPAASLDRTWVKLTGKNSQLPYFWNFEIRCIDISGSIGDSLSAQNLPPSYPLYSLGMTWFCTLLSNSAQNPAQVCRTARLVLDSRVASQSTGKGEKIEDGLSSVFLPGNIYWVPRPEEILPREWQNIWEESLDLGWSLIRAGSSGHLTFNGPEFRESLRSLRRRIVGQLFSEESPKVEPSKDTGDAAVLRVLLAIKKKWEAERAAEVREDLEVETETVVVPSRFSMEDTLPLDFRPEEELEGLPDTLIISPKGNRTPPVSLASPGGPQLPPGSRESEAPETDESEKTVILGPPPSEAKDLLPETVILSPAKKGGPKTPMVTGTEPGGTDEQAEKEVLFDGAEAEGNDGKPVSRHPEDEILMETVIIHPRKNRKQEEGENG